jgi:hypothetical protein
MVRKDTIIENTGNNLCISLTDIIGIGLQDDSTCSFEPSNWIVKSKPLNFKLIEP